MDLLLVCNTVNAVLSEGINFKGKETIEEKI
jgi:hypothetical protein